MHRLYPYQPLLVYAIIHSASHGADTQRKRIHIKEQNVGKCDLGDFQSGCW